MNLRFISFNIHKGYNLLKRRYSLNIVRELLETYNPDIVMLQELHGLHPKYHKSEIAPLEELADKHWPFYSHGVNSVYKSGFHGNAILSRYPIKDWQNTNISTNPIERRGLLRGQIQLTPDMELNIFCTHLNLTPPGQTKQAQKIMSEVSPLFHLSPLVLAGDFNDWTGAVRKLITQSGDLNTLPKTKTFPSMAPLLSLDGFYYHGLKILDFQPIKDFRHCSDHLPLLIDCQTPVSS